MNYLHIVPVPVCTSMNLLLKERDIKEYYNIF